MSYGLLDIANETRRQGLQGLEEADKREQQRVIANKQMEAQQKAQKTTNMATGAASGALIGAQYGAAAGPWGAVIGAGIGLIAGSFF